MGKFFDIQKLKKKNRSVSEQSISNIYAKEYLRLWENEVPYYFLEFEESWTFYSAKFIKYSSKKNCKSEIFIEMSYFFKFFIN